MSKNQLLLLCFIYFLDAEKIVMEYGKFSENRFSCDFLFPLSFLQAFAIAVSSVDTWLLRE